MTFKQEPLETCAICGGEPRLIKCGNQKELLVYQCSKCYESFIKLDGASVCEFGARRAWNRHNLHAKYAITAYNNAIKRCKETTKCYVNVNEFAEHIKQAVDAYWADKPNGYYLAEDVIDDLLSYPAADVEEVRHAFWETDRFGMERSICSLCKATFEGGDNWNYCPKCGAKLDIGGTK